MRNGDEKREKKRHRRAETQKLDGVRLSTTADETYIAAWLVPDNFRDDISQLHDSSRLSA